MRIYGVEITETPIEAAMKRMRRGEFEMADIESALMIAGVPDDECVVMVAATRLRHRASKAGLIEFNSTTGFWSWRSNG